MEVGRNTPEADAAGMGYTDGSCCGDKIENMVCFQCEWQREIKERRGGPLDEVGMRAVVSPKEEGRRGKGK